MKEYFLGKKLYGDNFEPGEITKWIKDEKEAYANLTTDNLKKYEYHELNKFHGYSKLKTKNFQRVLCFGGGTAQEILPIIDRVEKIYVLEPSKTFRSTKIKEKKIKYIEPEINGKLKIKNNSLDLITCFGVLHHIPNVSATIRELKRVLKKGGFLLIREPTVSMGDWRKKRVGITKRERGIPLKIFKEIIQKEGFKIVRHNRVMHPLSRRGYFFLKKPFNNKIATNFDNILSKIFSFNKKYHATKWYHKIQPQSIFYILEKQ